VIKCFLRKKTLIITWNTTLIYLQSAHISGSSLVSCGQVTALCHVEYGPTYKLALRGQASLAYYHFNAWQVDFGRVVSLFSHVFFLSSSLVINWIAACHQCHSKYFVIKYKYKYQVLQLCFYTMYHERVRIMQRLYSRLDKSDNIRLLRINFEVF